MAAQERCLILVAEDDPPLQKLIVTALRRRRQFHVGAAGNGAEAIDALQRDRWNALVLDLMMPTLSGWDVIAWLTQHPEHRPSTVVVVSAADRTVLREVDPTVVNAIIFKPFDLFSLVSYIRAACELSTSDRRRARIVG
jgi:CheY-like chemotaxis protein